MKTSRIKLSGLSIKTTIILIAYCLILSSVLCLNCSYAAMKRGKDIKDISGKQRAFIEKYRGVPADGYLIDNVPFYEQKERNYCGPVVLSMVMNYWEGKRTFTQEKIAEAIFDENVEVTNNSDMVFYPQSEGFLVSSLSADMDKLKELVKKDIPVVILQRVVDKVVNKGHYRVVIGYDESKEVIILHDPWLGDKLSMNYRTFSQLWDFGEGINRKNWTLVILPPGKRELFNRSEESALTYHNIATALYNRDRLKEAIKEWEKAIEITPEEVTFYYCISYTYIQEGNYDKAVHYGELAVELDSNNSFCYDTLGWAYYKKGMLQEALRYLEKAVHINPDAEFIKEHYNIIKEEFNE